MEKEKKNIKEKQEISTVLLLLFLGVASLLGAAVYGLSNYYFINASLAFDPADSSYIVMLAKDRKLKSPDLSVFTGDKFNVLEKGYWHEFDETDFERGNTNPFNRIIIDSELEEATTDIK